MRIATAGQGPFVAIRAISPAKLTAPCFGTRTAIASVVQRALEMQFGAVTGRVLVVDDDSAMRELIAASLKKSPFELTWAASAEEASIELSRQDFDAVLTDLRMPGSGGLALCSAVKERFPDVPVVVMTAFGSMETAVQAIRAGAYDFLAKPFQMEQLRVLLGRVIAHRQLDREVRKLRQATGKTGRYPGLLGDSQAMCRVYDMIDRIAQSDSSVLVTGETGTGKEIVARTLHEQSRRAEGPFMALNCAAMPEHLIESELFGHSRGAFTDARASKQGLLVQASGGTLFLDEIGDMPLSLQPKLLRALQERRVRPLGSSEEVPFDVRVIAATHRDLDAMVQNGRFRQDLYYRINVVAVNVPPLRERGTDVLLLAHRFLEAYASRAGKEIKGLTRAAAEKLFEYSWPGNVRELQNCMERAVALTVHSEVGVDDLPSKVGAFRASHLVLATDDPGEIVPLEEVKQRYVRMALEATGGNRSRASQLLGIDRKTLYRKLDAGSQAASASPSQPERAAPVMSAEGAPGTV
jgi:two-component system response regulator HydG